VAIVHKDFDPVVMLDPYTLAPADSPAAEMRVRPVLTPSVRHRLISEAAYFLAERRGFAPGNEWADWLEAEREVNAIYGST